MIGGTYTQRPWRRGLVLVDASPSSSPLHLALIPAPPSPRGYPGVRGGAGWRGVRRGEGLGGGDLEYGGSRGVSQPPPVAGVRPSQGVRPTTTQQPPQFPTMLYPHSFFGGSLLSHVRSVACEEVFRSRA